LKKGIFFSLLVFMFLVLGHELFAFGRRQVEEERAPIDTEWTLYITAFDVSAMSPAWQTAGDTLTRRLVAGLQNVNFRLRGEDEYIFQRDLALARSKRTAAEALARKRSERDLLIFRGDPGWRYQRALRAIDADILKLEEDFAALDGAFPVVETKPVFKLHSRNIGGVFLPPPEPGMENRFLTQQNADAFLTGRFSEFHGRIFLELEMYTRYTASFSFLDEVLFSPEDFDIVLDEITGRLTMEVFGDAPSMIIVHATPPEAMVLIDGLFAGHGEVEYSLFPGEAEISLQADNYISVTFPLELDAGEYAEVFINLTPLGLNAFGADTFNMPGSRVFQGALFVGETPLTLELPRNELVHITVETVDGEIGSVIYRDNSLFRGSAQFVRLDENYGRADFITALPATDEERRVARARNAFYITYGVLWFALPAGLLARGFADNHLNSRDPAAVSRANLIMNGANGLIGVAVGATVFQIFRYIRASRRDAMPLARVIQPEPEPEPEIEPEPELETESELETEPEGDE
jgi:hypothetical protein